MNLEKDAAELALLKDAVRQAAIVLLDGRSGSGKTTLAGQLAQLADFQVIHLDEYYPGWAGLRQAISATEQLLATGCYWRWDWVNKRPAEKVAVPTGPLIIEGVGAISWGSVAAAHQAATGRTPTGHVVSLRLQVPAAARQAAALARDPEFYQWWWMWAEQEERLLAGAPRAQFELHADAPGGKLKVVNF